MISFRLGLCVAAAVFCVSCAKDGCPSSAPQEHSGFGYACNLQSPGAELQFEIYSGTGRRAELLVRCRCRFDYDSQACVLEYGPHTEPLSIPPDGKWQSLTLPLFLYPGINVLKFKRIHPMKDDVAIDFIEVR